MKNFFLMSISALMMLAATVLTGCSESTETKTLYSGTMTFTVKDNSGSTSSSDLAAIQTELSKCNVVVTNETSLEAVKSKTTEGVLKATAAMKTLADNNTALKTANTEHSMDKLIVVVTSTGSSTLCVYKFFDDVTGYALYKYNETDGTFTRLED